jgi:hypothetical protein
MGAVAMAARQAAFSPASLFAAGEPGAWWDPSDMSTLFQDSAGTTPVTAVEQPVGRMLDKSGRGNHAFQSTAASRPVLSARVNLLTKTEQFDDAVWQKARISVSANAVAAPNGLLTAEKLIEDTTASQTHAVFQLFSPNLVVGAAHTFSFYAKASERSWVAFGSNSAIGLGGIVWFNLTSGTVGTVQSGWSNASIISAGDGWYKCSVQGTPTASASANAFIFISTGDGVVSYTGDGTSGIYIWGADLRVANDGVGLPAYQRVNTSTDYDTAGFPMYLRFDGVDDGMVTNSINFTSTDKMTVWAGVRKTNNSTNEILYELSANITTNNGAFSMFAPVAAGGVQTYAVLSKGSVLVTAGTGFSTYLAPITNTTTHTADISSDLLSLRINGAQAASSTANQGTGPYGNYPLYIGRRGGTTLPFNGRLHSLIVRGAQSTTQQIAATETYVNSKTKAFA